MRIALVTLTLLLTWVGHADADGWWEACKCDASSSASGASIGAGLALAGIVAYGIGHKRRRS